jgi:hypothetical protein
MKKLLLASVFAIASFPGYAQDIPIEGGTTKSLTSWGYGCTDKNGNPSWVLRVSWDPLRPHDGVRCVPSPAKPKGYIPIASAVPDWFSPPQCDKLDGSAYNVCVNQEWEKHKQEPPVVEEPPLPPSKPVRYRFKPRQMVWQCNDLRVTWTESAPGVFNYDIGGTIWGGINFTAAGNNLYLRGVPCVRVR